MRFVNRKERKGKGVGWGGKEKGKLSNWIVEGDRGKTGLK
jgi:hypothetical protein